MNNKNEKTESKKNKLSANNFLKKYMAEIIAIAMFVIGYVLIYMVFSGKSLISAGPGLSRADWLAFSGAYLAFMGAVFVAVVTLRQNKIFNEQENNRRRKERHEMIRPIFSVVIVGKNATIPGTADVFSMADGTTTKHKNIQLRIKNVGQYPVTNVIIFEKYFRSCMNSGETLTITVAYEDSVDLRQYENKKKQITKILRSEYEDQDGFPKWFNISYNDADGSDMFQTFSLRKFEDTLYYSLQGEEFIDENNENRNLKKRVFY